MIDEVRFPIGDFEWPVTVTPEDRARYLDTIASQPTRLREAVAGLSETQLSEPYREGGWTVRQVVHHLPDSHINSYVRFKLALTENEPLIKPYDEAGWAELPDSHAVPIEVSLRLLENLHERWIALLRGMSDSQWEKRFRHPERGMVPLAGNLALYAWHGDHHIAHIMELRRRRGW